MPPAGVVVASGWAWSRGRHHQRGSWSVGRMGIRIYRCLASLEGVPGGSPASGGGGGAEAATAPPEPGGGGTWPRRVSVGTWRTAAAEAAGAGGGGGSGGGIPLPASGIGWGSCASEKKGRGRKRKERGGRMGCWIKIQRLSTLIDRKAKKSTGRYRFV
jgi:hypothetical protein